MKRNQRGFTLVELLIVVVILGVLAAVAALAVGRFMGKGSIEAANTEAHQVRTAVVAYMADQDIINYDGIVGPSQFADPSGPEDYLDGSLEGRYVIEDGQIVNASSEGKWKDFVWDADLGMWAE